MRILTWNINGLSTVLQYHPWNETKSYETVLNALEADIICLQEIKCQRTKITRDMAIVPGYDAYFSFPKTKHGYSGVAVYVKQPLTPEWTEEGITGILNKRTHDPEMSAFLTTLSTDPAVLDSEGRCIIMDFKVFVLFNIYFPNEGSESRREFKMDYHHCVRKRVDDYLKQGRQVVLAGDLNAVHEEIDHCDPKKSKKDYGIDDFKALPHRQWVDQILTPKGPLVDLCRRYHPDRRGMFTCWNMRLNARPANYGTRIDYVLASEGLEPWFKFADIRADIQGSDHCPAYADFADEIPDPDDNQKTLRLRDLMTPDSDKLESSALLAKNFNEFSDKQKKLSTYFGAAAAKSSSTEEEKTTVKSSSSTIVQAKEPSVTKRPLQKTTTSTTTVSKRRKSSQPTSQRGQRLLQSYFAARNNSNGSSSQESTSTTSTQRSAEEDEPVDLQALLESAQERQDTKETWSALFKPRQVPRCRVHNEPCKEMTVTKKGPNQGRRFYLCSRPLGPQDDPSNEYRCNFFQWKHERSPSDKR